MSDRLTLITGVGSGSSNVGRLVARRLLESSEKVRVLVHHDDGRADDLREAGAEVVTGDLRVPSMVAAALSGVDRVFFNLSVSADYLRAATVMAAIGREKGDLEVMVAMSQMTVSQMTATSDAESEQQRLHWLVERVFDWSGLPVVHVRPTVFMDNPIFSVNPRTGIVQRRSLTIPIGDGPTSPVAAVDVGDSIAQILLDPAPHIGKIYELTGPEVLRLDGLAEAYGEALGVKLHPEDVPLEEFAHQMKRLPGIGDHVLAHLVTIARLHREGRYARLSQDVQTLTGRPATRLVDYISRNRGLFLGSGGV